MKHAFDLENSKEFYGDEVLFVDDSCNCFEERNLLFYFPIALFPYSPTPQAIIREAPEDADTRR